MKRLALPVAMLFVVMALASFFAIQPAQLARAEDRHGDKFASVSVLVSTTNTIVAGVSGKKINVRALTLSASGAGTITFQDGSGGTAIGHYYVEATKNPAVLLPDSFGGLGMRTTAGNGLFALGASGVTLYCTVRYSEE